MAPGLPPEASPIAVHNSLISFVHAVHSLKRCSLLCLPLLHHQHKSVLTYPHLSFKKGAINVCPLRSWKNLLATPLGARRSWGLTFGLGVAVGSLNALLPSFLSSISLRHCWLARSVVLLFKKAKLSRRTALLGGGEGRRLLRSLICLFVSFHFPVRWGLPEGDGVALIYQPLGEIGGSDCHLLSWPGGIVRHPSHGHLGICKQGKVLPPLLSSCQEEEAVCNRRKLGAIGLCPRPMLNTTPLLPKLAP